MPGMRASPVPVVWLTGKLTCKVWHLANMSGVVGRGRAPGQRAGDAWREGTSWKLLHKT